MWQEKEGNCWRLRWHSEKHGNSLWAPKWVIRDLDSKLLGAEAFSLFCVCSAPSPVESGSMSVAPRCCSNTRSNNRHNVSMQTLWVGALIFAEAFNTYPNWIQQPSPSNLDILYNLCSKWTSQTSPCWQSKTGCIVLCSRWTQGHFIILLQS